ncbi:MAG: hypothetical protein H5T92_00305 [Synergistales bacterium]|nr:hypothetical protein [Synergistales bacterium]
MKLFDLSFLELLGPDYEWFPRRCMTSASKGQVLVSSERELLAEIERANYTDCFLATHTPQDRSQGILRVVFIDIDNKDLDLARRFLERALKHLKDKHGVKPYCQFSGAKGYHIIIPIEPVLVKDRAQGFLRFLQVRLSKGYCDPQILGDVVRLFRIPDTINSKSGKLCYPLEEWDGQRLDVSELWEEYRGEEIGRLLRGQREKKLRVARIRPPGTGKPGIRPQVQLLIKRMEEGQNLAHMQRLAVVAELIAEGWEDSQILELFQRLPDFDEARTRYYLSHARLRGYKPFRTETLKEVIVSG